MRLALAIHGHDREEEIAKVGADEESAHKPAHDLAQKLPPIASMRLDAADVPVALSHFFLVHSFILPVHPFMHWDFFLATNPASPTKYRATTDADGKRIGRIDPAAPRRAS